MSAMKQLLHDYLNTSGWFKYEHEENFWWVQASERFTQILDATIAVRMNQLQELLHTLVYSDSEDTKRECCKKLHELSNSYELDALSLKWTGHLFVQWEVT